MRTRREIRQREEYKKWVLSTLGLVFFIWLMFFGLPSYFTKVDCKTAQDNIRYIERCIANDNCTLTQAESERADAYYRLEIMRCPVKD